MLNVYVTSTIKNEGKTFLSAGIAATMQSLGYSTCVYKPVQTAGIDINGFTQSPDLTYIKSLDPYIETKFSYVFKTDSEPLIAAEKENVFIDTDQIFNDYKKVIETKECTILDGDGAILSPLSPDIQNADMIKKLQIPAIFVLKPDKDSVGRILPAIYSAQDKGINIKGVVINRITTDCPKALLTSTTRIIEEYSGISILGLMPEITNPSAPDELITEILNGIDIEGIFGVRIEKLEFSS